MAEDVGGRDVVAVQNAVRQCDQGIDLSVVKFAVAVFMAGVDEFYADGMGIDIGFAVPKRYTRMPGAVVFIYVLCDRSIFVDHVMGADAAAGVAFQIFAHENIVGFLGCQCLCVVENQERRFDSAGAGFIVGAVFVCDLHVCNGFSVGGEYYIVVTEHN